jgi:hypothetical protein
MKNRWLSKWIAIALIGLFILTGCVQQAALPETGGGKTPAPTSPPPTSTPTQVPSSPSGNGPGSVGETPNITLADDGKTITLQIDQAFLLDLGEGYDWTVTIADQSIVSREIGVLTIRGSQGLFKAHKPGRTTLTATGDPTCLKSQPPCAMPSKVFQLTIVVK